MAERIGAVQFVGSVVAIYAVSFVIVTNWHMNDFVVRKLQLLDLAKFLGIGRIRFITCLIDIAKDAIPFALLAFHIFLANIGTAFVRNILVSMSLGYNNDDPRFDSTLI